MWHENYVAILDLNVNKHHSFRVILTYISFCFLLRVQLSVLQASCLQSWITALRDPPWQLLEMSLSQFLKGGFTPLVPSTFWDTGEVQWVSMNGPSYDSIPISATKHIQPLLWTDKWDLEEGKPKVIDWSIQADWYERNLHWRGWISKDTMGSSLIPRPLKKILLYDPVKGALTGITVLIKDTLKAAKCFNTLRSKLENFLLDLRTWKIPLPDKVDLISLQEPRSSSTKLLTILCWFCYQMLDLLGFIKWAACIFDWEIDSQN